MQEELPAALEDFGGIDSKSLQEEFQHEFQEQVSMHDLAILDLEEEDLKWKLRARKVYSLIFVFLLGIQNLFVFLLVAWAFFTDQLGQLAIILGTLLIGTLAETAVIIKIMVTWIFSNSDYQMRNNN